jgi:hypothetical protein
MQDEDYSIFANAFQEDRSSTDLFAACYTLPASDEIIYAPHSQPCKAISASHDWARTDTDYMTLILTRRLLTTQFHDSQVRGDLEAYRLDLPENAGYGDSPQL